MCVPSLSQTRHCSGSSSKAFAQPWEDLFLPLPAFILQPGQQETVDTGVRLTPFSDASAKCFPTNFASQFEFAYA